MKMRPHCFLRPILRPVAVFAFAFGVSSLMLSAQDEDAALDADEVVTETLAEDTTPDDEQAAEADTEAEKAGEEAAADGEEAAADGEEAAAVGRRVLHGGPNGEPAPCEGDQHPQNTKAASTAKAAVKARNMPHLRPMRGIAVSGDLAERDDGEHRQ